MNNSGFIYKIICPITEKVVYIGKTITPIDNRLKKHISKTKTKIKYNRKLSKNEFWLKNIMYENLDNEIKIEIIEECSISDINDREIFWISEYRKNFKLNNITEGGDGGNWIHTEDSIKKISINRTGKCKGEDHWCFGKERSEEVKRKISESSSNEKHWNFGKYLSEETKEKISNANLGDKNGMFGKRMTRTNDQKKKLSDSLKNSSKLKKSRQSSEFKEKISNHFSNPLYVLDEGLNIIMEFKNAKKCAEYFNYKKSNISNAVRFMRKIGKSRNYKYWIIKKDNYLKSIELIKNKIETNLR